MKKHTLCLALLWFTACGSIGAVSLGVDPNLQPNTNAVFMFATDFFSAGQMYTADYAAVSGMANAGVTQLGSSAIIRFFWGKLYVLHDGFSVGSSDNVTILNPTNGFAVEGQWSTGNGTNPQDIIVMGTKAYISLYSPELDAAGVDAEGHPADVIVMNLATGIIEKRLSFFNALNDDGNRTARAARMLRVENHIYVCVQDLEGFTFTQNASGKIGVINTETDALEEVITLKGRNPVDIVYSADEDKLFVALQAPFDPATFENLFATSPFGGVEIVPLDNPQASILIPDDDLGGYVERVATGGDFMFAVVSKLDLASFAFTSDVFRMMAANEEASGLSRFLSGNTDVRAIGIDGGNRLWVARRAIIAGEGGAFSQGVDVFDIETGADIGSNLSTSSEAVYVTSIAFGNL